MATMPVRAKGKNSSSSRVLMRVNRGTIAWMMSLSDDRLVLGVLTEGDTLIAQMKSREWMCVSIAMRPNRMRLRRRRRKQEKGRNRSRSGSSRADTYGSCASVDDTLVSASSCGS